MDQRKYVVALTHRQAGIVKIALQERWGRLDKGRAGQLPPDDEWVIEEQQEIEAVVSVLNMAMQP